ncbi:hypothetical protein EK904_009786 [Melospiza melodia maxima]|nr:hypothetical protein EK904_009786 [Melospiza melodia maxima]
MHEEWEVKSLGRCSPSVVSRGLAIRIGSHIFTNRVCYIQRSLWSGFWGHSHKGPCTALGVRMAKLSWGENGQRAARGIELHDPRTMITTVKVFLETNPCITKTIQRIPANLIVYKTG